jgi:hypothetical protein
MDTSQRGSAESELKMIGYAFLPEQTNGFYKPVYSNALDALNWAQGPILYHVEVKGKTAKEKDGVVSDSMIVLGRVDSSHALRYFAKRCAWRTLPSFSGTEFSASLPGVWRWLNHGVKPKTWDQLVVWARTHEMVWMNGGHAEASICNALLSCCEDKEVWYHSWLAGAHTRMLLGKQKETAVQEKSLRQVLNKELTYAA